MLKSRQFLVFVAVFGVAGCRESSPVAADPASLRPLLDGGQTLGSGHRSGGDSTTTVTGMDSPMAVDSGTAERGGQTLGSGH
jgi:hypothetical protein